MARELDLYGNAIAGDSSFIPFLYQGQYYDEEIGLAYNRFRYYSPESGTYISQDPIRWAGGLVGWRFMGMYSIVMGGGRYIWTTYCCCYI